MTRLEDAFYAWLGTPEAGWVVGCVAGIALLTAVWVCLRVVYEETRDEPVAAPVRDPWASGRDADAASRAAVGHMSTLRSSEPRD